MVENLTQEKKSQLDNGSFLGQHSTLTSKPGQVQDFLALESSQDSEPVSMLCRDQVGTGKAKLRLYQRSKKNFGPEIHPDRSENVTVSLEKYFSQRAFNPSCLDFFPKSESQPTRYHLLTAWDEELKVDKTSSRIKLTITLSEKFLILKKNDTKATRIITIV